MIYPIRRPVDMFSRSVGQWWFDLQTPIDWGPVLTTVTEPSSDSDDKDNGKSPSPTPIPEPANGRPKCMACGDPNFSPNGGICIACRLFLPAKT